MTRLPRLRQVLARVGDLTRQGAGRHGQRTGEVDAGLLVAHAAGEVAVGGADAAEGAVEPAKRVAGAAQAGGTRRLPQLRSGGEEDFFQRLAAELLRPQPRGDLAGGGD